MRVHLTDHAEADLEEIADYIALDNPPRAMSFALELRAKSMAIGDAPRAARARPDLGKGVRVAIRRPYLILFRINQTQVEILRFIHGARDLKKALKAK